MITYGLGTITYKSRESNEKKQAPVANVDIPIALSKGEYDFLLNSIKNVGKVFGYSYLFSMVQWNYEDLIKTINNYINAFVQRDAKFLTARDISLNINKDILNILTSFRFYLDYMGKNLKDDFSTSPMIIDRFEDLCRNEYDNNFSYRFIYHLRNYAQHKGVLVNSVKFSEIADKENPLEIIRSLKISLSRNDILEDKKFKKELKLEVARLPENIDPIEHIFEWLKSLARIHEKITSEVIPTGLESAKVILNYSEKLNYDLNDRKIVPSMFVTNHSDDDVKLIVAMDHAPLPIQEAKKIFECVQK